MNKKPYDFQPKVLLSNPDFYAYTFVSVGKQGEIVKLVAFQPMGDNTYNLAMVDYDETNELYDDETTTNNGDMGRVLATTWAIMLHFLQAFPDKSVWINGNTDTKKKLYNRLVANNLLELKKQYDVFGLTYDVRLENFELNKEYFMILIQPQS
jgi:hypothetical protein